MMGDKTFSSYLFRGFWTSEGDPSLVENEGEWTSTGAHDVSI